jgi:hypothetical protein
MHLHGNANRHMRENARCIAAMQIASDLTVIPGRAHLGANPESRAVLGAGFRVCAQEGASRNDENDGLPGDDF